MTSEEIFVTDPNCAFRDSRESGVSLSFEAFHGKGKVFCTRWVSGFGLPLAVQKRGLMDSAGALLQSPVPFISCKKYKQFCTAPRELVAKILFRAEYVLYVKPPWARLSSLRTVQLTCEVKQCLIPVT